MVSVNYRMSVAGYATGTNSEDFYEESFIALPASIQYRAPRITPIPRTHGPQTARVVGPEGEEIWTDKYGRIKVQFHWDRYGKKNENSSCWVRVSSPWAGGGFGGLQLPRIKDEVVVDFIGGCPDRPIVLGRVYNANNMPPVELPGKASISGFRSQSVFGDTSTTNLMYFDDTLGAELVALRSQMNMITKCLAQLDMDIGADLRACIGGSSHTLIHGSEFKKVMKERHDHVVEKTKLHYEGGLEKTVSAVTKEKYKNRSITSDKVKEKQGEYHLERTGKTNVKMKKASYYIDGDADIYIKGKANLVVEGDWTADANPEGPEGPDEPGTPTDPTLLSLCCPK